MSRTVDADLPPCLSLRGISKRYGRVEVLQPVDLDIPKGQILALIGENGAGKSTLMKIIAGAEMPTAGVLTFEGAERQFGSPEAARRAGISIVYQEHALLHDMSVAENLFLGRPLRRRSGLLDVEAMVRAARGVLGRLGATIDVRRLAGELSLAEAQIVEIARALLDEARLVILDEPTAALERRERETLFGVMRDLAASGVTIIFCSHHLDEITEVADRTIVLRDGVLVDDLPRDAMRPEAIIQAMIGGKLKEHYPKTAGARRAEPALVIEGLRVGSRPPLDLRLARGEILGLAGLEGCGRVEVARAIFGLVPAVAERVEIAGRSAGLPRRPGEAMAAGLGFLPADRKSEGLFLDQSIVFNASIAALGRFLRGGLLSPRRERGRVVAELGRLDLRYNGPEQEAGELSGGNQQKVMLARWFGRAPQILLFEEPTRGIDVRARAEVYRLIGDFVAGGGAAVLVSSDNAELVGIADRVIVLYRGRAAATLEGAEISEAAIARYSYSEGLAHVAL